MATDKTPAAVSTLPPATVKSLGAALRTGVTNALNSGNALADFLAACVGAKLPATVLDVDVNAIVEAYADGAGWDDKTAKVRKSEARNIVRAHATLPEAITAFRTATGKCGYNDTVALARRVAKGETVTAAVTEMTTAHAAGKVDPTAKVGKALQSYWNAIRDGKRKNRAELMAACEAFAKSIGAKLKTE